MRQHYHRCMVCGEIAAHSNHTALTCLSCLEAGLKYCNVCGRVLPLEAFTKKRDKYASDCLECHRGLNSPAYQENRRRAEAIRRKDPAYRDRKNALNRLHYHSSSAPSAQAAYWANKNHARRARLQGSFTERMCAIHLLSLITRAHIAEQLVSLPLITLFRLVALVQISAITLCLRAHAAIAQSATMTS